MFCIAHAVSSSWLECPLLTCLPEKYLLSFYKAFSGPFTWFWGSPLLRSPCSPDKPLKQLPCYGVMVYLLVSQLDQMALDRFFDNKNYTYFYIYNTRYYIYNTIIPST